MSLPLICPTKFVTMAGLMGVTSAYENPSKAFISWGGTVGKAFISWGGTVGNLEGFKFGSFVTK